jgi:hypothetical protein
MVSGGFWCSSPRGIESHLTPESLITFTCSDTTRPPEGFTYTQVRVCEYMCECMCACCLAEAASARVHATSYPSKLLGASGLQQSLVCLSLSVSLSHTHTHTCTHEAQAARQHGPQRADAWSVMFIGKKDKQRRPTGAFGFGNWKGRRQ